MTTAENLGQLIQYFYLHRVEEAGNRGISQMREARAALERGGAGAVLFVTDP